MSKGKVQLINSKNLKGLENILPDRDKVLKHLFEQKEKSDRINEYNKNLKPMEKSVKFEFKPIVISVNKDKFDDFESQLRKMKPGVDMYRKAFDLIYDSSTGIPIIQITQE